MKNLSHRINLIIICTISLILFSSCTNSTTTNNSDEINVVTSFYPIYIIAENVIGNADGIVLKNMAPPQTGCLHDYQLTTGDMKELDSADIFIINGGGMENFLDNALSLYPDLKIIDSSIGVTELSHEHIDNHENDESLLEGDNHNHEDNSHFWILPSNAAVQAKNICSALISLSPENSDLLTKNTDNFIKSISSIPSFDGTGIKACVFNEAFEYFELSYNMEISATIEMDENETPSAKELADIINKIKSENIQLLITADDAGTAIAETIARETNAKVIKLDPVLTGDYNADSYIDAITKNTELLNKATMEMIK